jgi:ubiquinone/menaquinone biosynthesis C-methylase UbiE
MTRERRGSRSTTKTERPKRPATVSQRPRYCWLIVSSSISEAERDRQNARRRRAWDKQSASYDKQIGWFERHVFGEENRPWACRQASGDVLEVAVGTGLNLPFYGPQARFTGIDLSPAMLEIARKRAADLGRQADLREGDAHNLTFDDDSFDSVVCTFSLCNIPDVDRAVDEMRRVLKPGGRLVLVDHIRSASRPVYWVQKAIEYVSVRVDGDRMTRRPLEQVRARGFTVDTTERFKWGGIVERVLATKAG